MGFLHVCLRSSNLLVKNVVKYEMRVSPDFLLRSSSITHSLSPTSIRVVYSGCANSKPFTYTSSS